MTEPLALVGLDGAGQVVRTATLRPRTVVRMAGAKWILEMPPGAQCPSWGARVTITART